MIGTHDNWREVWNRKKLDHELQSTLQRLIAADGFDSSFGGFINANEWIRYVESIATKLKMGRNDSIFEVGCGAGAFLYPFYEKGHRVAGIDYAENLVKIARDTMPSGHITVGEAIRMPEETRFDIVTSHSVFFYFHDLDYAAAVLQRMFNIAVKGIGIFDVPDASKKNEAIRYRKAALGEAEYEQRYKGLEHLYYDRAWFSKTLGSKRFNIVIEDQNMPGYRNNEYRFNVFIRKN